MLSIDDYNTLRLSRSKNVGPATFFKILKFFNGNINDAINNINDFNFRLKLKNPITIATKDFIDNEIVACSSIGAKIITYNSSIYPSLLKQIENFPPVLTLLGNTDLLRKKSISIIGSRNASSNGCNFAKKISKELGERNYIVTSGFASGIDSSAHRGSLETGTIAVLGGGIDDIYPKGNEELYYQIKNKGLIISESPFGGIPRAENFPSRNRIVSGLSIAVIVIEAGARSGTLHTANQALEQNRELLVAPGNPYDPRCEGSNRLLKEGATPITCVEDIIDIVEDFKIGKNEKPELMFSDSGNLFSDEVLEQFDFSEEIRDLEISNTKELILNKLNHTLIPIDLLSSELNIDVKELNIKLMELELDGKILVNLGSVKLI